MDNYNNDTQIKYYKNRIISALQEYQDINNIDLHKISKTRWKAALAFVYDHVFKPETITWRRSTIPYDNPAVLNGIADIYINLCNEFEKDISIYGYSILTGISYIGLMKWNNNDNKSNLYIDTKTGNIIDNQYISAYKAQYGDAGIIKLPNNIYRNIVKKLSAERQESLKSITLDGSIPALALGKIEYGWIEGGLQQKQAELLTAAKDTADLLTAYKQKLINTDNNTEYSNDNT